MAAWLHLCQIVAGLLPDRSRSMQEESNSPRFTNVLRIVILIKRGLYYTVEDNERLNRYQHSVGISRRFIATTTAINLFKIHVN